MENFMLNGSSPPSSGSASPDPVGNLPQNAGIQVHEQPEERPPTPFPQSPINLQSPTIDPQASISQLLIGHPILSLQPSTSGSPSDEIHPHPLTPVVNINYPSPALSTSSSAVSFHAVDHLIRKLREDRRMNEECRSRSIASGLYEFASIMMPNLPGYEVPMYDFELDDDLEERQRRAAQKFKFRVLVGTGFFGAALLGQQLAYFIINWSK